MQCRDMAHKRPLESNSKFKAVGLNPKNADAYYQRGKANKELGNLKAAENDYKQALVLAPGDKLVLAALQELGNKQAP
jgi:Flp pilus assembly protein TadD